MDLFPDTAPQYVGLLTGAGYPRDTRIALAWPEELLEHFCLRMSFRGMCVSRALMVSDRRYALEQLVHAHNMPDASLQHMAEQLFRHFEALQSGIGNLH